MENVEKHAFEALFIGEGKKGVASIKVSYFEIVGDASIYFNPGAWRSRRC